MTSNGFQKIVLLTGSLIGLLAWLGCEKQLPSAFRTEKQAPVSDLDARACHYLTQPATRTDTVVVGGDTTYVTRILHVAVAGVRLSSPMRQAWVDASDSLVTATLPELVPDTTLLIQNAAASDTIFARYENPSVGKTTYFFISWDLDEQNYDAYIELDLFQKDGQKANLRSTQLDLATIAGCTQTAEIDGQPVALPKIRVRAGYQLTAAHYLVRFYLSEPMTIGTFRMAILHND